jgi:hypothetical protein
MVLAESFGRLSTEAPIMENGLDKTGVNQKDNGVRFN